MNHYLGNVPSMAIARSRITAQGQISIPAEIRRRLGLGPGSTLEWDEDGGRIVVRRSGRHTSEDIHKTLFPRPPRRRTLAELKEGLHRNIRSRRAHD